MTMSRKTRELRKLMFDNDLKSPEVAGMTGHSSQSVRRWIADMPNEIPDNVFDELKAKLE